MELSSDEMSAVITRDPSTYVFTVSKVLFPWAPGDSKVLFPWAPGDSKVMVITCHLFGSTTPAAVLSTSLYLKPLPSV